MFSNERIAMRANVCLVVFSSSFTKSLLHDNPMFFCKGPFVFIKTDWSFGIVVFFLYLGGADNQGYFHWLITTMAFNISNCHNFGVHKGTASRTFGILAEPKFIRLFCSIFNII